MRLGAHRPDPRASCAVLLYEGHGGHEGGADRPDPYGNDPYDDGYDPYTGMPHERGRRASGRAPSGPPPATRAVRDALTRWRDSLFHTEPGRVAVRASDSSQGAYSLQSAVGDAHDLLLVHYAGTLDADDPYGRPHGRGGLPLTGLFHLIEGAPARHIVVVLEPDRPTETHLGEALHHRYEYLVRHFQGRLTLIVADPVPRSPRPFLADALGGDGPLSVHALAAHPRAQVLTQAKGPDVLLARSGRRGGREPVLTNRGRALGHRGRALGRRTRSALTTAGEATASALSAVAPFALVLLALAAITVGLFALLRALPPMRGTWGAATLLGLWAVLAVIGIVAARLRTPPARARPPGSAPPEPRGRAFMDGMYAAWGFSGPLPDPAGRPRQPVLPRPTREESRAAVERSLNALYARLPVPQMRAPDPPPSPASPSSPSPDDNGTTP
ncbi:hypothetical protein AB0I94_12875 [Streptomyces sp. NPDC050147]|uniref:hypothetical protein n=1 Tax=Streptomyces sp. NPDC050147 TaxID=3155513 RepID=UPI0034391599